MRNVNKTTSQISGVGSLHGGIGKTLTGTVGRDEVLQHAHSLLEVRQDRVLDNLCTLSTSLLWLGHKSTHTGKLTDLVFRTTGSRVKHHVYGVESLIGLCHLLHQYITELVVDVSPGIDYLVVTLLVGDESHIIVVSNLTYFVISTLNECFLLLWDDDVVEVEGKSGEVCHTVTEVLDTIEELAGTGETYCLDNIRDDVTQALLGDYLVYVTYLVWNDAIHDYTTY